MRQRTVNYQKAPFPWFGGKSQAAPLVWSLLGDVAHYVEPFFGSGAVLLNRPHPCNRTYHSETVCDADGFLVNAWRAIQFHPEETARHASWPVSELDKYARQIAVLKWRTEKNWELLAGTPDWCDPKIAGWWLWAVSVQIGAFAGDGPWTVDPVSGRIRKWKDIRGNDQFCELGVLRNRPHITNDGRGVNHSWLREPGVFRNRPLLSDGGHGVNRPQLREPGVYRSRPHLSDEDLKVNCPQLQESSMLSDSEDNPFHPMTMPELIRWFQWLSARLRHVRIVHGDWKRVCTNSAIVTLSVWQNKGPAGIFLDPPYSEKADRAQNLYLIDSESISHDVREWCKKWGDNPKYRIVLAGYDVEHAELESYGWRVYEWFRPGFMRGGMGKTKRTQSDAPGGQQHRERLWASPHCLIPEEQKRPDTQSLFG